MPRYKRRTELSIRDLFQLQAGDRFIVFWAKDDDPKDVRLDYEEQTVVSNDGESIDAGDGYSWQRNGCKNSMSIDENMLDTSRGMAYFFFAK